MGAQRAEDYSAWAALPTEPSCSARQHRWDAVAVVRD